MKLHILHETVYRYTSPLTYTIQQLRLSPRRENHQHILSWQLSTPGQRHEFIDAFGNTCHTLTITGLHDEVRIVASGTVLTRPLNQGRVDDRDGLSPMVYTVPTNLTEPTRGVIAFAERNLPHKVASGDLLELAEAIRGAVAYQSGATEVSSTATDALELGQGVCQDHAHLFLACCHARRIPARYVSGYIDPGGSTHAESHAWVDVWVDDPDYSGWSSIDVTHACHESESYCRLAVGRDYNSAAPVRGVRRGGGMESLSVSVKVELA
jgi:transglutaminase-like putative cysteine protease